MKPLLLLLLLNLAATAQPLTGPGPAAGATLPPAIVEAGGARLELVRVPAGGFWMGSTGANPEEKPRHWVQLLGDLELGATELTLGQFRAFVQATGYRTDAERAEWAWSYTADGWSRKPGVNWRQPGFAQAEDEPVVCVSWNDAQAFCEWLSTQTRTAFRLPSEAEWEYACRAGTTGDYAGDPGGMGWEMGWHLFNSEGKTQPVAQKQPNLWGLYDMHGNVWELCADPLHPTYHGAPTDGRPWPDEEQPARIVRGGAWSRLPEVMRSSTRYFVPAPDCASVNIGFRVARAAPARPQPRLSAAPLTRRPPGPLPAAPSERRWTNSVGMAFAPVPRARVWFCVWETRVKDFAAFVRAADYRPAEGLPMPSSRGFEPRTWEQPGFAQEPDQPVVLVSWDDAQRFCAWLTAAEHKSAILGSEWRYRLPTDVEWSRAAGPGTYPWGESFPPPPQAGNYAGTEARTPDLGEWFKTLRDYEDGYARTAPVGRFAPNAFGLYDLGGNVWEWCADWFRQDRVPADLARLIPFRNNDGGGRRYRVLRGASWLDSHPVLLRSQLRCYEFPDHCTDNIGFRVVLAREAADH